MISVSSISRPAFFADTDEISDDALLLDPEDLAMEAIAQKFANEVEDLEKQS